MVHAENQQWNNIQHSIFSSRYAAHLVLSDYSGQELCPLEQLAVANQLTETATTAIESVTVDVDPLSGYMQFTSTVEGEDEAAVLGIFSHSVIKSLVDIFRDPEHLEFVAAHVAYEQQLKQDNQLDPTACISQKTYMVDVLPLFELNDIGEEAMTDAHRIFSEAREAIIRR